MVIKTCTTCGKNNTYQAKGMCHNCYQKKLYWTNNDTRERKKQRMREYIQNQSIMSGQTNTLSFGIYLRKQLNAI